jgi:Spy/CpxP family protein refolding chaperone
MKLKLKTLVIASLAAFTLLVAAPAALAQRGGGFMRGGGSLIYIQRKDVQKDLALTDQQAADLDTLQQKIRSEMTEIFQGGGGDRDAMQKAFAAKAPEWQKQIEAILKPEQVSRLKEIAIQMQGNRAVATDPELQTKLKITDDQKAKMKDLMDKQQEANQGLRAKVQSGEMDRDAMTAAVAKNNDALNTEIAKILTDDQKKQLAGLSGKKFDKDPNETGFGGGGLR